MHRSKVEENGRRGADGSGKRELPRLMPKLSEPWMHLWMLTDDELLRLASDTGWLLMEERRSGPWRIRLFESKAS